MPIEKRNIVLIYLLGIVTLGIYFIYWLWKTKNELNELGAEIPTAWLIIIPFANIYWLYKYSEGFAKVTKKRKSFDMVHSFPLSWYSNACHSSK
ncbi:MAG: DUF4234 domain-containing protein [Candidatus Aenigmatarchaeota archaeon]